MRPEASRRLHPSRRSFIAACAAALASRLLSWKRARAEDGVRPLLERVHPDVRIQVEPLADEKNAWTVWLRIREEEFTLADFELRNAAWAAIEDPELKLPGGELGERLERWIESRREDFERIDEGAARGRYQSPAVRKPADPPDINDDITMRLWEVIRLRLLRAALRAREGKLDGACDDVLSILRTAAVFAGGEYLLIHFVAGLSFLGAGLDGARHLAGKQGVSGERLREILAAVERFPDCRRLLERAHQVEFCCFLLPQLARYPGKGGPEALAAEYAHWLEEGERRDSLRKAIARLLEGHPRPFDLAATIQLASGQSALAIENARRPWNERRREIDRKLKEEMEVWPEDLRLSSNLLAKDGSVAAPAEEIEGARRALARIDNPLGKALCSEAFAFIPEDWDEILLERACEREARRQATCALLGLRLLHDRSGRLPGTLDSLAAEKLLAAAPEDPFTGKALGYSRERRLLWSAGPDGRDDGGREPAEGDPDDAPADLLWKIPESLRD